jgi:nucleotidyltransferase substrate binding protein (TIGR01987 family)
MERDDLRADRYLKTLRALESVLAPLPGVPGDVQRDSLIQRYEFCFEALWKLLQRLAETEGIEAASPRKAFLTALSGGWIDPDDETTAWEMIRFRNLTVHTYDEDLAREVETFVRDRAMPVFRKVAARIGPAVPDR